MWGVQFLCPGVQEPVEAFFPDLYGHDQVTGDAFDVLSQDIPHRVQFHPGTAAHGLVDQLGAEHS